MIATATELFEARHFPGVVAMCSDALDDEPECVALLVIRARARIALRRDLDAQADLRDVIRLDPACGLAYRLLGELAARRDENTSAAGFFREAMRLDPGDREARDWLLIVDPPARPAAVAPAIAAAAGHRSPALGAPSAAGVPRASSPSQARLARGTQPPDGFDGDDRPTRPFGRVEPSPGPRAPRQMSRRSTPTPEPLPRPPTAVAPPVIERPTLSGRPPTQPPARPAPRLTTRGATPELPGFGEYLVSTGILSRERLRAAQAYQRSMRVQLATAIVTLGLASPQRIAWAAVAHQSQLAAAR